MSADTGYGQETGPITTFSYSQSPKFLDTEHLFVLYFEQMSGFSACERTNWQAELE